MLLQWWSARPWNVWLPWRPLFKDHWYVQIHVDGNEWAGMGMRKLDKYKKFANTSPKKWPDEPLTNPRFLAFPSHSNLEISTSILSWVLSIKQQYFRSYPSAFAFALWLLAPDCRFFPHFIPMSFHYGSYPSTTSSHHPLHNRFLADIYSLILPTLNTRWKNVCNHHPSICFDLRFQRAWAISSRVLLFWKYFSPQSKLVSKRGCRR